MLDLKVSVLNGIQKIILNRPTRKNAFNKNIFYGIADALKSASADDNVKISVLTGEGDFYSSGNDIKNFIELPSDESSDGELKIAMFKNYVSSLIDYPKLLIAVVNGPAVGIACTSLGLCDLVIASDKAYFITPFTKLGLTAEGCSTLLFPKILGYRKALEMLLFNHKMSAREAKEYNFVNEIVPHAELDSVWDKLYQYTLLPPGSVLSVKNLIRNSMKKELHAANELECEALMKRLETEEFFTMLQTFLMKSSNSKL